MLTAPNGVRWRIKCLRSIDTLECEYKTDKIFLKIWTTSFDRCCVRKNIKRNKSCLQLYYMYRILLSNTRFLIWLVFITHFPKRIKKYNFQRDKRTVYNFVTIICPGIFAFCGTTIILFLLRVLLRACALVCVCNIYREIYIFNNFHV